MKHTAQSEVGEIQKLLIKHPRDAFINQANVNTQWKKLNYFGCPDYEESLREYESFVELLKSEIPEIHYLPQSDRTGLDSIYARDALTVTNGGVILCNMGKGERQGEPPAAGEYLTELDMPILGAITGEGRLEGGDIIWLDQRTLIVGLGYRTNREGIRQLQELTRGIADEVITVALPHWNGPDGVFHLMSMISPVDRNLAVVYSRLLPVPFREFLIDRGIELVEVPDEEYSTMACNVLAVAPRECVMLDRNPRTKQMLEYAGAKVYEIKGDEISRKGAGGPTCLTRPIYRTD